MADEKITVPIARAQQVKDWRSDREKSGWCRCGKREDELSPRCEWHSARPSVPEVSR